MKALAILFSLSMLLSAQDHSRDEEMIYTTLEEVVDATFDHDFEALSERINPQSLQFFRKIIGIQYDRLLESCTPVEALELVGLDSPPAESKLSDKDLFVKLSSRAKQLNPNFVGSEELLPLDIIGTVFAKNSQAYVVYQYSGSISSEKSSVGYLHPRNLTFKKIGTRWYVHSAYFTNAIPRAWRFELLTRHKKNKVTK